MLLPVEGYIFLIQREEIKKLEITLSNLQSRSVINHSGMLFFDSPPRGIWSLLFAKVIGVARPCFIRFEG